MKLLTKEQVYIKSINEKAVHWDKSILGLLVNTILSPFSWLKNLKGAKKNQLKIMSMQWGAEYATALDKVLSEVSSDKNTKTDNNEESDGEELKMSIEDITEYKKSVKEYLLLNSDKFKEFETFVANLNRDPLDLFKDYTNLAIYDTVYDKKQELIFSTIETFKDIYFNTFNSNEIISTLKKLTDQLNKLKIKSATELNSDKINELPVLKDIYKKYVYELNQFYDNLTKLNMKQFNESYIINEDNNVKVSTTNSKAELPDNVKELYPEALLAEAKDIKDIKIKTSKHINFASLNTIRYQANYLINSVDKGQDVLRKTFEENILQVNDYFQHVIDTKLVMSKATGQVDADTENAIEKSQSTLNEMEQLGIEEIKVDSQFLDTEVYAFHVNLKGGKGKGAFQAVLFLSPIKSKVFSINKEHFLMKYLGAYRINKDKKVELWDPFEQLIVSSQLKNKLSSDKYKFNYLLLSGLRPNSKRYFCSYLLEFKKEAYLLNSDDIVKVDEYNFQEVIKENGSETLQELLARNTGFTYSIYQRYNVSKEKIDSNFYPEFNTELLEDKDQIIFQNFKNSATHISSELLK